MKIDGNCIKCLASVLKQRHFHTNLHLTNSAANENFMYALELDALPAKQQAVSEKMKKLEVAGGDSRTMVKEPVDEVWKGWGMLIL